MRILHTMLRVGDLEKSIWYYTKILGMTLLRQKDYPSGRFTLAFLGYGAEKDNSALELTHNWDITKYDIGGGFGHIAVEVQDIYQTCEKIKKNGGCIIREPGPMKHGGSVIAFSQDPDGYKVELIESSSRTENV